jgi:uncharacterized repeat protein (TIGR01451 family)
MPCPRRLSSLLVLISMMLAGHALAQQADGTSPADGRLSPEVATQAERGDFPIEVLVDFSGVATGQVLRHATSTRQAGSGYRESLQGLSRDVRSAGAGLRQAVARVGPSHLRLEREFDFIPRAKLVVQDAEGLEALLATPGVMKVLPELLLEPHLGSSLALISQPTAANSGATGDGTAIVVMDTGVFYGHSDFGNCTAPGIPASCRVVASLDIAPDDGQLDDTANPHGTNVSAIVARTAPGTDLIVLDVFGPSGASSSDVTAAYDWVIGNAATYNIKAVNLSLGVTGIYARSACGSSFIAYDGDGNRIRGFTSNPFQTPIDLASSIGIATITSSGNSSVKDGLPMPACTANAISVGAVYDANHGSRSFSACTDATTAADQVTCFSNSASFLDVLAPGAFITAGGWQYAGTSQAAPHVAGAWAVLASEFPGESIAQLRARLVNGGVAITDAANGIVKPRIDFEVLFPPPANDDFAGAGALSGSSASTSTSNRFASKQSGEPSHAGNAGGKSLWWNWTAPASGLLTVSTSGSSIDTLLAIYTGGAVNGLTAIASNDNAPSLTTSALTAAVTAGSTYRIAVDGKDGAWGVVVLDLALALPSADLTAALAVDGGPVATGSALSYEATVTNAGPDPATNVTAILTLPGGMVAGTPPAGCTGVSGSVNCSLASLASGASMSWIIPATATAAGTLQASLTVASTTGDPNGGDNSTTGQTIVVDPADIALSLTPPALPLLQGTTASFTLEVANLGLATATDVVISVQTSGLGAPQAPLPSGCSEATGGVSCSVGSLVSSASLSRTLVFALPSAGAISLEASAGSSTPEASPGNETAVWSGSVTAVADLSLAVSSSSPTSFLPGDPLVLDVLASNAGPSNVQSVVLTVALPNGITLTSADVSCSGTTTLSCPLGSLAAAGSASATLALNTTAAVSGSEAVAAQVSGSGPLDINAANDTATLPIEVQAATPAEQVPTLPTWLLLLAAAGLCVAGARSARQRRAH